MAEESGSKGGGEDLLIGAVLFGFLIIAWFVSGAAKEADLRGIFLMPTFPLGTPESTLESRENGNTEVFREEVNRIAGEVGAVKEELALLQTSASSPYRGKVSIASTQGASEQDPKAEYVTLRASDDNRESIAITGWTLESAITGKSVSLPQGSEIFTSGSLEEGVIVLKPGDEVTVVTGRSPVGISFRINRCSGYLTQFQTFTPTLSKSCPRAESEALSRSSSRTLPDSCFNFLEGLGQCRIELSLPPELSQECRQFIQNDLTYNGCVALHRNETNFKNPEWRIYLSRPEELWKEKREMVKLLDGSGKLVDTSTY